MKLFSKLITKFLIFFTGFVFGIYLAYLVFSFFFLQEVTLVETRGSTSHFKHFNSHQSYSNWLKEKKIKRQRYEQNCDTLSKNTTLESQFLRNKVKIVCLIFYGNGDIQQVFNTWSKNCNENVFISEENELSIHWNSFEGFNNKPQRSQWERFFNFTVNFQKNKVKFESFDWFFFAFGTNLLVILENLRFMLTEFNPEEVHYLGKPVTDNGIIFNQVEAGFVLSKGALRKLRNLFQKNKDHFLYPSDRVDQNLGKIFMENQWSIYNTLDERGCSRFHSKNLPELMEKNLAAIPQEAPCISNLAVSFLVDNNLDSLYFYFYILYKTRFFNQNDLNCDMFPSASVSKNDYKMWIEDNKDLFGIDPQAMSKKEFYDRWVDRVVHQDLVF